MAFMKAVGISQMTSFRAALGLSNQVRYPQEPTEKYSGKLSGLGQKSPDDK